MYNDAYPKQVDQYNKSYPDHTTKKVSPPLNPFQMLDPFLHSWTVGFDPLFDMIEQVRESNKMVTYPPYNIVQTDDYNYAIEIAVAGFSKKDLKVTKTKNELKVEGTKEKNSDKALHRGIANRDFTQNFLLADDVVINDIELEDGLLSINLEKLVPKEDRPQVLKIN
jgi:molecular chaperone IbpA